MSDSISRHGVSAWLQCMGYPKLADIVMNEQRFPSVQPEQKWIPCSERLPEEYGNYLITTHDGNVDIGTIDPKKKYVWSACDSDGFYWLRDVLAWMPLPEPYREESEE